MHTDILGRITADQWLVTGWFTEDYAHLARAFSANLDQLSIPHHLYARVLKPGGFVANTLRKPEVLLTAFADYPGKTLVLCDVDMQLFGDISPIVGMTGDVLVASGTKAGDCVPWKKRKRRIHLSSRVMVWKNNDRAKALVRLWKEQCDRPGISYGDETALIEAYVRSEGVGLARLPPRFSGHQKHSAPADAVFIHDSEYDKRQTWLHNLLSGKFLRH
mgnify:CR=1 FL=1